jgi:hypothetical protein
VTQLVPVNEVLADKWGSVALPVWLGARETGGMTKTLRFATATVTRAARSRADDAEDASV